MRLLLKKLVSTASYYPYEYTLGRLLYRTLVEYGFTVEEQEVGTGRFNLLATKNPTKGKSILFYGHIDTVLPSIKGKDVTAKFKNNRLYGLGALDMKAGLAAILEATKNTDHYVKILFCVDEEQYSQGAYKALERKEFFKDVELIISAEPNFGKGLHSVTTGRLGREVYTVTFTGEPTHIINQDFTDDPIERLILFMYQFQRNNNLLFRDIDTSARIRLIESKPNGMSTPAKASCEIEVLTGLNEGDLIEKWEFMFKVKFVPVDRPTPFLKPYFFKDIPHREKISGIIYAYTKKQMKLTKRASVGDDNVLATLGIPVITWGPDGEGAHTNEEWVDLSSVDTLIEMYKELL